MRKIRLFGIEVKNEQTLYGLNDVEFLRSLGITTDTPTDAIGEITYHTCLKTLSEIMGKLDIRKYQYDPQKGRERVVDGRLDYLLNVEPNEYYTATTLKQAIELNRNHYGNACVYVERFKSGSFNGQMKALWLLPSNEVTFLMDDKGYFGKANAIWYVWQDSRTGNKYRFADGDILHFKSWLTFDGIVGLSVKDILAAQINTAIHGRNYIHNLYKGNMVANKVILNYTGKMETVAEKQMVKDVESHLLNADGTNMFIPLPLGITATVLDSKLVDSEFSALRQANALQIAAAFGVSPNFINDYSKSSYANSVTQQQSLYTNTMMPIFKLYGEEYSRKLLLSSERETRRFEIDTKALFKLNPIEQMDVISKAIQNFTMTPNEAREEMDKPYYDHPKANELIGNGNIINLDAVGNQVVKGGE